MHVVSFSFFFLFFCHFFTATTASMATEERQQTETPAFASHIHKKVRRLHDRRNCAIDACIRSCEGETMLKFDKKFAKSDECRVGGDGQTVCMLWKHEGCIDTDELSTTPMSCLFALPSGKMRGEAQARFSDMIKRRYGASGVKFNGFSSPRPVWCNATIDVFFDAPPEK
jgi:hypothetical protein